MSVEPTTQPAATAGTVTLGDLTVNRMAFGAMRLTGSGRHRRTGGPANALAILRRVVELGVNFIDTADAYGPAVSEKPAGGGAPPLPARARHWHQGRSRPGRSWKTAPQWPA